MEAQHRNLLAGLALALAAGLLALLWNLAGPSRAGGGVLAAAERLGVAGEAAALAPREDPASVADEERPGSARVGIAPAPVEGLDDEAAATEEDGPERVVLGRVVTDSGAPIEGARVFARQVQMWVTVPADLEPLSIWGNDGVPLETLTDAEGVFRFGDLEPGDYGFLVRAPGFAPLARAREEIPQHERLDLGLFRVAPGVVVEGRVVGRDGQGVPDVQVLRAITESAGSRRLELTGLGAPVATTGADGGFRVDSLAPGGWHLLFDSPGHRLAELTGTTAPAGRSERGLIVRLEEGATITGRVEGFAGLEEGALRVSARRTDEQQAGSADDAPESEKARARHAAVRADGTFELAGLGPSVQYKVVLEEPREQEELAGLWTRVDGVDGATVFAGARDVVLERNELATLRLRLVDARSGAPIPRFTARISGDGLGGGGTLEGEDGEPLEVHPGGVARFEGLRPQRAGSLSRLFVRAPGYELLERENVRLRPGEDEDLGDVAVEPAPTVLVRVVDDASGSPVERALVLAARGADTEELDRATASTSEDPPRGSTKLRYAFTDASGRARVSVWRGELVVLRARADGHLPPDAVRATPPHEGAEHELRMEPCARVTVRLVEPSGAPVAGLFVKHEMDGVAQNLDRWWDAEQRSRFLSDENGEVRFEGLPAGTHSFETVDDPQRQMMFGRMNDDEEEPEASGELRLVAGDDRRLELEVDARGGLQGRLLAGGEPLVGALARLTEEREDQDRNVYWFAPATEDPRTKISDHEGRVRFEGLPTGRYRLDVTHPDRRMPSHFDVELVADPREQVFELGVSTLEGRVVDPSGQPLAGLRVYVNPTEGRPYSGGEDFRMTMRENEDGNPDVSWSSTGQRDVRTDRGGRFVLPGVTPDEPLSLSVQGEFVVGASRAVAPLAREEVRTEPDFVLPRAGRVQAHIREYARDAGSRIVVVLTRPDDEGFRRMMSFRHNRTRRTQGSLLPGRYVATMYWQNRMDEPLVQQELDVAVEETTDVHLAGP